MNAIVYIRGHRSDYDEWAAGVATATIMIAEACDMMRQ
jgi:hypothetical protein